MGRSSHGRSSLRGVPIPVRDLCSQKGANPSPSNSWGSGYFKGPWPVNSEEPLSQLDWASALCQTLGWVPGVLGQRRPGPALPELSAPQRNRCVSSQLNRILIHLPEEAAAAFAWMGESSGRTGEREAWHCGVHSGRQRAV